MSGDGAERLRDKLVVLGTNVMGVGDHFRTPFDPALPGVEVQATAMANLFAADFLQRGPLQLRTDIAATLVLAGIGAGVVWLFPPIAAAALFVLAFVMWLATVFIFYGQGIWLSTSLPLLASFPFLAILVLARQVRYRHRARREKAITQELGRFQAPELARLISQDSDFLLQPRQMDAAVLFVDLAGFTAESERLGPAATADLLRTLHTHVVEISDICGGTVLSFLGNGAMVGFGLLPNQPSNPSADALRAGFLLSCNSGTALNDLTQKTRYDLRIGAHFGAIVLTRLGHDTQQQISVAGDCVNVASRLLETGKEIGCDVVVSDDLLSRVAPDEVRFPPVDFHDTCEIRGRVQRLEVHAWRASTVKAGWAHGAMDR